MLTVQLFVGIGCGTQMQPPQMGPAACQQNHTRSERWPIYDVNLMGPIAIVEVPLPPPLASAGHAWPSSTSGIHAF